MITYTTVQGDTFDIIAKKVLGDEHHVGDLMEANLQHISVLIFSAGVTLNIPEITEVVAIDNEEQYSTPPWERGNSVG